MTAKKTAVEGEGGAKKKSGGKKGNGLKQRHRFTKPDGRTLDVLFTEAKGQFNVRATLIKGEGDEVEKETGAVHQGSDREAAQEHYDSLVEEAKTKGWQSRKAGVLSSQFDELPD